MNNPVRPQRLQLSLADEALVADHLEVLKFNGFELNLDDESSEQRRFNLVANPVSKNTQFDMKGEKCFY